MSTNSNIGIINENGSITTIYCHWDGHVESVGHTLLKHWNTEARVRELMNLGDLSILGEVIGEKHDFHKHDGANNGCLAYGRDRGETGQSAVTFSHAEMKLECRNEYTYIFNPTTETWSYRSKRGQFKPLTLTD